MKVKCPKCKQTRSLEYQGQADNGKKIVDEYWCEDCKHIVHAVYKLVKLKIEEVG